MVFLPPPTAQTPPQAPPGGFPPLMLDLDAMFRERQILAQFDASKNGRLENAERKAAREWLAKQPPTGLAAVVGRFAGPGGPGGPAALLRDCRRSAAAASLQGRQASDSRPMRFERTATNRSTTRTSCARSSCSSKTRTGKRSSRTSTTPTSTCRPCSRLMAAQYRDVGVRFRGMSSFAFVPEGSKRSLNVSIDFADDDQRVHGLPDAEPPERQQRPDVRARSCSTATLRASTCRPPGSTTCGW